MPNEPPEVARQARLEELQARFNATLQERVGSILNHAQAVRVGPWPGPSAEAFLNEVHGLAGSAGLFGHERVGDAAAAIERVLVALGKKKVTTAVDIAMLRDAARRLESAHAEAQD